MVSRCTTLFVAALLLSSCGGSGGNSSANPEPVDPAIAALESFCYHYQEDLAVYHNDIETLPGDPETQRLLDRWVSSFTADAANFERAGDFEQATPVIVLVEALSDLQQELQNPDIFDASGKILTAVRAVSRATDGIAATGYDCPPD